jgi:hypothetical protein
VHFFEPLKDGVDHEFDLVGLEFVLGLDFVVELSPLKQLDDDV